LAKLKALIKNEPYLKDVVNNARTTLPYLCAENNYVDAMKLFIDAKIDCTKILANGLTIFHQAIVKGSLETLKLLLHHKPSAVNLQSHVGDTLLHYACSLKKYEIMDFLLQLVGIDVNIRNKMSQTSLQYSCQIGYIKVVSKLLDHPSIDLSIKDSQGRLADYLIQSKQIKDMITAKRLKK